MDKKLFRRSLGKAKIGTIRLETVIDAALIDRSDKKWPDILVRACETIGFGRLNQKIIQELEARLSSNISQIIVEFPYRDFDFSSTYSMFYTKKHKRVSRESLRLHFFGDKIQQASYYGFMTLRPSLVEQRGRSHISPKAIKKPESIYIVTNTVTAHLFGQVLNVESFPWMAQETDIAVCAHVAVWSIINYYATKYPRYRNFSIAEIASEVPGYLGRTIPSEGLNLLQISTLLTKAGFYPLFLKKDSQNPEAFFQAVYAYIESGIPLVGAMTKKEHAIAIIGHGPLKNKFSSISKDTFQWSVDCIDSFIISDDNTLPLTSITRQKSENNYCFEDLDYILIPLYEKMYLNANVVIERIRYLIKAEGLDIPQKAVCRPYLTSTRSLKKQAFANKSMNDNLKNILLRLPTPQFVWCADFMLAEDCFSKTYSRIIIDSTAGSYEDEPWLLLHDQEKIIYYDNDTDQWYQMNVQIDPYPLYVNNLMEY